ncbi:MAG TPA: hypothetical protein VGF86_03355 [Candidatus Tumulicola sp.]|jgi:hypothetical protein
MCQLRGSLAAALALAACSPAGGVPSAGVQRTGTAVRAAVPTVGGCSIFPSDNWWNTDISKYPVDPRSDRYIASIPGNLHPDFGRNPHYGIPFDIVPSAQAEVPISFDYESQSDPGPYPIPPNAQIEGGRHSSGDRHVLVLQKGVCKLFEMWRAFPKGGGTSWHAGSGAIFPLDTDKLRPDGWTSADAAGLPILPALIKCDEVAAGAINHALRFTVERTQAGYIHPATHFASSSHDRDLPPMGLRVRLKASFDISGFNRTAQIILTAMKTYGMFVADNGSNWYFQGEGGHASKCWNDDELDALKNVPGTAFEVVKTGRILHKSGP